MGQPTTESPAPALPEDLGLLTAEHFSPLSGQPFEAVGAEGMTVTLVLADIVVRPECTLPNAARESFSLMFTAPVDGPSLDGGLYILRLPTGQELPPMTIFRVVPRHWAEPAAWYQAAFN